MLVIRRATVQQAQDAAEARRAVVVDADSTNVATARHTVVMAADGAVAAAARFGAGAGAQAAHTGAVTVEVGQRRQAELIGDKVSTKPWTSVTVATTTRWGLPAR